MKKKKIMYNFISMIVVATVVITMNCVVSRAEERKIDKRENISETEKVYCEDIITVKAEAEQVDKGSEVWADISLEDISNKNFAIHNIEDISKQTIVIKYDDSMLNYTGACIMDKAYRILNVNEEEGRITIELFCKDTRKISKSRNMIALSFDAIGTGIADVRIESASITDTKNNKNDLLPIQCGGCSINITE